MGAPSSGPTTSFPIVRANDDTSLWDFLYQWQGDHVAPILRPAYLPDGLEPVTVGQLPNKLDRDLLFVAYSGPAKQVRIMAGGLNPGRGTRSET